MYTLQAAKTALGNGSLRKLTAEEKKVARITALKGKYFHFDQLSRIVSMGMCLNSISRFRPFRSREGGCQMDGLS